MSSTFLPPRWRAILTTTVLGLVAAGCGPPQATAPGGIGCVSLGVTLDYVRWSADGNALAVGALLPGRIFLLAWPSFEIERRIERAAGGDGWEIYGRSVAMRADGAITWLETLAFPEDIDEMAAIWSVDATRDPSRLGMLPHPRFSDFYWIDGVLHSRERSMDDDFRLVRFVLAGDRFEPEGLTEWRRDIGDWWVSRNGERQVFDNAAEPGDPVILTVTTGDGESQVGLPDAGGMAPSIAADGMTLIYRDPSSANYVARRLDDGAPLRNVSTTEYYDGEISDTGYLAAVTAYVPTEWENEVCVEQTSLVSASGELAASSDKAERLGILESLGDRAP